MSTRRVILDQPRPGTSAVHGIFLGSQAKEEKLHNADPFLEIRDLRLVKFGKPFPAQRLRILISIDLSNCEYLINTPDFTNIPNLEILTLKGCIKLQEVHPSVGVLEHLVLLNLNGCKCLQKLPDKISLRSLETFILSRCSNLNKFPEIVGDMKNLSQLYLDDHHSEVINLQLPSSFAGLTSLISLNLSHCNLQEGAIPNDIGCLSSLQNLDLSGNNFKVIPESFSQLSKLRELDLSDCRELMCLPLPLPLTRIPEWCSKWRNNGSSITINLSPEDNFGMRKGFTLFFAFEIKEQDNIHEGLEPQKTACLFHSDEGGYLSFLPDFKMQAAGSYGFCRYLPRGWFQEKYLNQASGVFGALILTERQDLDIKMCGLHIIFEQDVEEFSQKLFKTHAEFQDLDLNFIQHCRKFLDGARELNNLGEPSTVWDDSSHKEQGSGKAQKEDHAEPTCATKEPNSSSEDCVDDWTTQMRRDTQTLLSRLFEGRYAHYNPFSFIIPVETVSSWFLHHCVGDTAICYLLSNLYDDERWVGLDVYVRFKRSNPSETPSLLFVDLYAHGTDNGMPLPILSFPLTMNGLLESSFVVSHVPRAYFPKQLNQCQGISVLFTPVALSNVKVDLRVVICGTRLLYEQDSTSFIDQMVNLASMHPSLLQFLHYQAKSHIQKVEEFLRKAETHKQIEEGKQRPGPSSLEWSFLQSLQKLLTSTKPLANDVANTLEKYRFYRAQNNASRELGPMLVHSKEVFSENLCQMQRSAQVRGLTCSFNHFHIMPDKVLRFGGKLNEWRHDLEILLESFFIDEGLLITLSVGGKLIAVTKRFDPNLVFNFCFPQKEMLDWFQVRSSTSRVAIELPPNLYNDSSWDGLAVCAAFSVNEHPNAFSEMSVDLLCHLSVNGHCLNPVPSFSVTKDRYNWLHLRGFIWLTYIPRLILIELDQQRNIEARIFSSCPGLVVKMCGIRVLYHQDVKEFRHAIIQCSISIFDTSDFFQYVGPFGIRTLVEITDEQNTPLHANDRKDNTESRFLDESTIDQSTFRQTSNEEFDQNSIYNSCFPAIEIRDWFGDQSRFDSSGKIHLPPDINSDNNWIGLTMCAYFSDLEITDINHKSDLEIVPHVTLFCEFETENGSLRPHRHHQTTEEDLNLLRRGGFVWLSFLPRRWFYEANHEAPHQLNECRVMKAAFESDIQGIRVRRCAFRLLYQHEVEEFKQTIRNCILNTSSPCDKKISESSAHKLPKDKGKRVLE
ncbi:hypothetical protein TIFTF001_026095 [Ficus carica]|uniref:C-JID domain-containing protein n=1 Tax=Ficus carica TaxID=3494 RepID=A0AA88AL02_FICCA|nr:hypothetical protein TIFTF001_026095 [Ficus carica]